jgi:hypothetical protein
MADSGTNYSDDSKKEKDEPAKGKGKLLRRILRGLMFSFFLLVILIVAFLNSTTFQTWAARKTAAYLSQQLQTIVSIDRVEINITQHLKLSKLYIQDLKGDTLLYAGKLDAGLANGLFTLFDNQLSLDYLALENARFNLHKDSVSTNIARLFGSSSSKKKNPEKEKKPLVLNLKRVDLKNVAFEEYHFYWGNKLNIFLRDARIKFRKMDLTHQLIHLSEIYAVEPEVTRYEERGPGMDAYLNNAEGESSGNDPPAPEEEVYPASLLPFELKVDQVNFLNGHFQLDNFKWNPVRQNPEDQLDYKHLDIHNIVFDVENFRIKDWDFSGKVNEISGLEKTGMQVEKFSSDEVLVTPTGFHLYGMSLNTPDSRLGDTLIFTYDTYLDFLDFENEVIMQGNFSQSSLALKDIMAFAPPLKENAFFVRNQNEVLSVSGKVRGTVNNLKGKDLAIRLGKHTFIKGEIAIRDVTNQDNEFLNLRLDRLNTTFQTLKLLIPNFRPPPNFDNLGELNFKGSFTGFLQDFVAQGELDTDLGKASMDMRLDLKRGKDLANYTGELALIDFDLGGFTNDPALGKVTFTSQVQNGRGLTAESAYADLTANVEAFSYKGYTYQNAAIKGELNKDFFKGNLSIRDDNIDLFFSGTLDQLQDSIPFYDFRAEVRKLDLQKLNLSKDPYVLSGKVSLLMENRKLSDLIGEVEIRDFILKGKDRNYELDLFQASSQRQPNGLKFLDIQSDVLSVYLVGRYDLQQIPATVMNFLWSHFPEWSARFGFWNPQQAVPITDFNFRLQVNDSKNFCKLLDLPFDTLTQSSVVGYFSNLQDSLEWFLEVPELEVGPLSLGDISVYASGQGDQIGVHDLSIQQIGFENTDSLFQLVTSGNIYGDTLHYDLLSSRSGNGDRLLHLGGKIFQSGEHFQFSFDEDDLILFNEKWQISPENYLRFGHNHFDAHAFQLSQDQRRIIIQKIERAGMALTVTDIDLSIINDLWQYEPLNFSGSLDFYFDVIDLYKIFDAEVVLESQSFQVNGDDWGALRADIGLKDLGKPIEAYLSMTQPETGQQLIIEGRYIPPLAWHPEEKKNSLDAALSISYLPLKYAEYFISDLISQSKGLVDANLNFSGPLNKMDIEGTIDLIDAATTINFLQTRYSITRSRVKVNNTLFDASGAVIRDVDGNKGYITGGITHERLRNFGLDVQMYSPKIIVLDTKKGDNDQFYGYGIGEVDLKFSGSFKQTELSVRGTSAKGTRIIIPVSGTSESRPIDFIRFVDAKKGGQSKEVIAPPSLRGMNLELNLSITRDAVISMIFDEEAGDIIKGSGTGNLRITVTRAGEFYMYGDYEVEEGEYLFTLYNLVNKPFRVKAGSDNYIRWSGDPYDATIHIDAEYSGLSTSLTNFLLEYLEESSLEVAEAANNPTEVALIMHLEGSLLRPDISFDIEFPELVGELQRLADSKINVLKRDPNELNRQVFGLIVVGSFLPSTGDSPGSGNYLTTGINTLSELLSSQLSIYLTELLSEVFTDVAFISGVDFDIAYNIYDNSSLYDNRDAAQTLQGRGSEIQLRQKLFLADDRISLNVGGNFSDANFASQGVFITHDIAVEIILTDDRRYKFRFYNRTEPRLGGGFQTRTGAGLAYRREFNSFRDLLGHFDKYKRKLRRK